MSRLLLARGLFYFRDDRVRRRFRVVRIDDRPADDEIVGAALDRARRRHDPFLVTGGAARRTDTRRHKRHAGSGNVAQLGHFLGRADETVGADVARLAGAPGRAPPRLPPPLAGPVMAALLAPPPALAAPPAPPFAAPRPAARGRELRH